MNNDENKIQDFVPIEQGELQLRKAFELATIQNVTTIKDFSESTRSLVRDQNKEIAQLRDNLAIKSETISILQNQMAGIHQKLYDITQKISILEDPEN